MSSLTALGCGWGERHAQRFALRHHSPQAQDLHILKTPVGRYDLQQIAIWDLDGETPTRIALVCELMEQARPVRKVRLENLATSMAQHSSWGGAMGRIDFTGKDVAEVMNLFGMDDAMNMDIQGCHPLATVARRGAWRWGPNSFPMIGLGCFVLLEPPVVCLQLFRAEALVGQGWSFLTTRRPSSRPLRQTGSPTPQAIGSSWTPLGAASSSGFPTVGFQLL